MSEGLNQENQDRIELEAAIDVGIDDAAEKEGLTAVEAVEAVEAAEAVEDVAVVKDVEAGEVVEVVEEDDLISEGAEADLDVLGESVVASETASEIASETASEGDSLGENVVPAEEKSISDVELDEIADTALSILRSVLEYFDVGEVTIDEYEGEEGELIFDITGGDLAVLIGRHGSTLSALQSLVSTITTKKIGYRYPVQIDVEGYRSRQRQKIEAVARSSANRAVQQGRSIKLRPMTPYERRIVHLALRDDSRVETASEGEGGARYVVVSPS